MFLQQLSFTFFRGSDELADDAARVGVAVFASGLTLWLNGALGAISPTLMLAFAIATVIIIVLIAMGYVAKTQFGLFTAAGAADSTAAGDSTAVAEGKEKDGDKDVYTDFIVQQALDEIRHLKEDVGDYRDQARNINKLPE